MFFNEVQARLVDAFEERCQTVYGPSMETVMR
jgi:ribosome-associated toxin RatA of RatAB toxin-antitoxin module